MRTIIHSVRMIVVKAAHTRDQTALGAVARGNIHSFAGGKMARQVAHAAATNTKGGAVQKLARGLAAPVFALALLASAALIFALQPMFARMVAPLLGGSPSVWNASMAFFQAALLAGYVYAHLLARVDDLRVQAAIHALVLGGAFFVLPIHVSSALGAPDTSRPVVWLLGVLALSIGAPFAAASATAPLLQSWFARTGRADAADPYYLYAASNLGSFAGLLAYPIVIEPQFSIDQQSQAWSLGYGLVCALIFACAGAAIVAGGAAQKTSDGEGAPVTWHDRAYWLFAAAIPASLVLSVTLHISTDVASAPLLWVVPLGLYLATFVIAFARGAEAVRPFAFYLLAPAIALILATSFSSRNWPVTLAGDLGGFFFCALACHCVLAGRRPHASRLTEFYFWISLGGVVGGAMTALAAPLVFNDVYEFPLALALAALFSPRGGRGSHLLADIACGVGFAGALVIVCMSVFSTGVGALLSATAGAASVLVAFAWARITGARTIALALCVTLLAGLIFFGFVAARDTLVEALQAPVTGTFSPLRAGLIALSGLALALSLASALANEAARIQRILLAAAAASFAALILVLAAHEDVSARSFAMYALIAAAGAIVLNRSRPYVLAALTLCAFSVLYIDKSRGLNVMTQTRTFFGVLRTEVLVGDQRANKPELRLLMHGTTLHGAQLVGGGEDETPITYYNPRTALGEAVLGAARMRASSRVALIGLGTGTTACLIRRNDRLTIYEIDPAVVQLSGPQGSDFSYVRRCQPGARVVLGDARLKIAEARDGAFDAILVDAFSSDAIPAHLLTREAVELYLSKLSAHGVLILHLSNRHLALISEASRVARDVRAPALWRVSDIVDADGPAGRLTGSVASVVILARRPETLSMMDLPSEDWAPTPRPSGRAWSDTYVNLVRAISEKANGVEDCRLYGAGKRCAPAALDAR